MPRTRFRSTVTCTCALLAALAASPAVPAASVELHVVDELEQPIANTEITLTQIQDSGNTYYSRKGGVTDPGGRVVFQDLERGRYSVRLFARRDFVSLADHPALGHPSITVESDGDRLRSTVRFIRGVPVVFRVSVEGEALPGSRVLLRDLDRDYATEIGMGDRVEREIRLVAGRWTARVAPVPGYLLTAVEVNRSAFPHDVAEFDLPAGMQAWYVNFEFAAPGLIWGRVAYEDEPFGVRIVSHLQQAGPWLPAAQARGGSSFETVSAAPVYPTWDYEMVVPDGRWLVRPEAPGLERAEPPQVEVQLEPGEERRVDFTVGGSSTAGGEWTYVRVEDAKGQRVRDAVVEAWPAHPDARGDAPIATGRTRWGDAILRGLAAGEYLLAAGKAGHVEASTISKITDEGERERVTLRLGRGTTVHAVARDDDGQGIAAVEVALTRRDDDVSLLASREIAEWARNPSATTDGTGHLWLRGVYAGHYRLSGELRGEDATMFFAEFRTSGDSRWSRELDKRYRGAETDQIEIRLASAGSVRATLHCSDGSELPAEADLLVLDAGGAFSSEDPGSWPEHAVIDRKAYVLEGRERDTFHLGPLDPGTVHVLVRPEGHNRWTWALGTEAPAEASALSVSAGEPTELGAIAIDCAPGIAVHPLPPDGVELPDLVATAVYQPAAECAGTVSVEGRERTVDQARVVVEPSRVQFRDLPEGRAELTLTLWNPFFLPAPDRAVPASVELERGKTVQLRPRVAGIGGAVELTLTEEQAAAGFAAVLVARTDPDAPPVEPWIFEIDGRTVLIPSLPAGRYEIGACRDPGCEQRSDLWEPVAVTTGAISTPEAKKLR